MKILVTGSSGMLGTALCQEFADAYETVGLDVRPVRSATGDRVGEVQRLGLKEFIKCDVTDEVDVSRAVCDISPDLVVHAAAYTDVDGCESYPDKAYQINSAGSRNVALACQKCHARGVYISTDFVFDGRKEKPYTEQDTPHPVNIYGRSKLKGERHFSSLLKKCLTVRTSWLFGQFGKNFVDTILKLTEAKEEIKVVDDQIGSPTYSKDLARAIGNLIITSSSGIFHISNGDSCSWYEFALTILKCAGIGDVTVQPITSEELNRPARRPKMSILDNTRYIQTAGEPLRPWLDALREYLGELETN